MSGTKLFARLAAWLLQARWRSAPSAPPLLVLVVKTPWEVPMPPVRVQTLGQLSVVAPVSFSNLLHLFIHLLIHAIWHHMDDKVFTECVLYSVLSVL